MTSASWPETSPDGVTAPDLAYSVPGSADALRHVMGHFASGVTIATALHHGIKHAMTATAVCSVSLEPPLVLVCVSKSSRFHGAISQGQILVLVTADGRPRGAGQALRQPRKRPAQPVRPTCRTPRALSAGHHSSMARCPGSSAQPMACTMVVITPSWWARLPARVGYLLTMTQTHGLH